MTHRGIVPTQLREALKRWAESKPTIKALDIFGSYARGEATLRSDLDLAFEFKDANEADAELISNAQAWKTELTRLTGIPVKDLYHSDAKPVRDGPTVRVFSR
jgi:predicted nucleotidyltransferase